MKTSDEIKQGLEAIAETEVTARAAKIAAISMTLKSEAKMKGQVVGAEHEAVIDGEDVYIITKKEAEGQMSIFDEMDDESEE